MGKTFITLLSTENYLKGVLVLYTSLQETKTKYPFTVLLSSRISVNTENILRNYGMKTLRIDAPLYIENREGINQAGPTHWNYTFEKLHVFNLTQFEKMVFLDSDMLVLENIDELFEYEHMSAVGPAGGRYPGNELYNGLNSGLLVIEPNHKDFKNLINLIPTVTTRLKNCGDQDVIIEYFIEEWRKRKELHLDDKYNMIFPYIDYYVENLNYTFKKEGSLNNIKIIHFIGTEKPWMQSHGIMSFARFTGNYLKSEILHRGKNKVYYKAMIVYKRYLLLMKA